jgi:hypothetical protein
VALIVEYAQAFEAILTSVVTVNVAAAHAVF